jgi:hypothetical protein
MSAALSNPSGVPLIERRKDERETWSTSYRAPKEALTFLSYESMTSLRHCEECSTLPRTERGEWTGAWCQKPVETSIPEVRGRAARSSMVKAGLLEPQSWRNTCVPWERDYRPGLMVAVKEIRHPYSLHQSQPLGKRKRCKGSLTTKRRVGVTWGSPTRCKAQGDGGVIVLKCSS